MNYLFKENKLYKFDNNIIVESNYQANNINVCIDEIGFKLFDKLDKENAYVSNNLLKVGKSSIKTIDAQLPTFDNEYTSSFELDLNILKEASKFADKRNLKPTLTGVYVNDLGTIIATDSFKVYQYYKGESNKYVVLSPELVSELIKLNNDNCILQFNQTSAQVILENETKITGRLLNGQYPNVNNLIKQYETNSIDFNKQEFLKQAEIGKLCNGEITIEINDNELTFKGDNEYTCEFKSNFNTYLNLEYIMLALNVLSNPTLYYNGENKPLLFEEDNKKVLIMTMKKVN